MTKAAAHEVAIAEWQTAVNALNALEAKIKKARSATVKAELKTGWRALKDAVYAAEVKCGW